MNSNAVEEKEVRIEETKELESTAMSPTVYAAREAAAKLAEKYFGERVVSKVPPPAIERLSLSEITRSDNSFRLDLIRDHFLREGMLSADATKKILISAAQVFRNQPNIIHVEPPCTGNRIQREYVYENKLK